MKSFKGRGLASSLFYLFGIILERVAIFILFPFITDRVSPEEFGAYSLLVLSGTFVNYFVVSPVVLALERFFHDSNGISRPNLVGNLLLLLVSKSVVAGVLFAWGGRCFWPDHEDSSVVYWYAITVAAQPLASFGLLYIQLSERVKYSVFTSLLGVLVGTSISLVALTEFDLGVKGMAIGSAAQYGFLCLASLRPLLNQAKLDFRIDLSAPMRWGYSLLPAAYSDLILHSGDRYLLAALVSTEAVGIYDLGYRLGAVTTVLLSQPFKRGVYPILLRLEGSPDEQKNAIERFTVWLYLYGMILFLGFTAFARELTWLVSSDSQYEDAWQVIPLVALAYVHIGIGQLFNFGIVMAKRGGIDNLCLASAAVTNVLLNWLLIPLYGFNGATIATLLSVMLWNALRIYYSKQLYQLRFDLRRLCLASIGTVPSLALIAIADQLNQPLWHLSIVLKISGMILYPIMLIAMRFPTEEEWNEIICIVLALRFWSVDRRGTVVQNLGSDYQIAAPEMPLRSASSVSEGV